MLARARLLMAFFKNGKYAWQPFERVVADDRRYSAWALRERREGSQLSRNLAGFVKYVKESHDGVMTVRKHQGLYRRLASPGNALRELADFARREQEEASTRKREFGGEEEGATKKCVICLERPLGACWTPCGHAATCYECAVAMADCRCPTCRKPGRIQKLFVG